MGVPQPNPPQRPIAELIGWRFDGLMWVPPDVSYSDGSPPNVDDLIAWMHVNCPRLWDYGGKSPDSFWCEIEDGPSNGTHPSLLDALEAAVRVVAAGGVVGETEPADPEAAT